MSTSPDLRFLIPLTSENRWTDLLATLVQTDRAPLARLLGIDIGSVEREVHRRTAGAPAQGGPAVTKADRLDLLVLHQGSEVGAIEAKLLAPIGEQQLERYELSFPGIERWLLHLDRFPPSPAELRNWKPLTWEEVLDAYAGSDDAWVAQTASAWRRDIDQVVPRVDEETVWNDVPRDVTEFQVALRARMAWLYDQLQTSEVADGLAYDLTAASNGGRWVLRVWIPADDHRLATAEISEGLPSTAWKQDPGAPFATRLEGPLTLVGLRHEELRSNKDFDWGFLLRMFTDTIRVSGADPGGQPDTADQDSRAWRPGAARPRQAEVKAGLQQLRDQGAPAWLGQGYAMPEVKGRGKKDGQPQARGASVFGARFGAEPTVTLGQVRAEMFRTVELLRRMAAAARQDASSAPIG